MSSNDKQLVINLTPTPDQAMKPAELIKMKADQQLSLVERRAVTVLWHNAHQQKIKKGKVYTIPVSDLAAQGYNASSSEMKQVLERLQKTLVVMYNPATDTRVSTQLLSSTIEKGVSKRNGVLEYRFTDEMFEFIKDSEIWGSIEIPVLMHLSSKYAISLYEQASQWVKLRYKHNEEMPIDEFRRIIAIEEKKYPAFGSLNKHVIKKAVSEINALADFNIQIMPIKTGKKVTHVNIFWHEKSIDEKKSAYQELSRHKSGRKARIAGAVETVEPVAELSKSQMPILEDYS
ncbi:replication initiation protein [Ruegeria atlantica]|uniref:replication initiation protein n=1 Tax=Ruegeria atlantica TaxID=81569 RepID=UPI00147F868C|nr:replication initiation protein [Ruegeria atlantica]